MIFLFVEMRTLKIRKETNLFKWFLDSCLSPNMNANITRNVTRDESEMEKWQKRKTENVEHEKKWKITLNWNNSSAGQISAQRNGPFCLCYARGIYSLYNDTCFHSISNSYMCSFQVKYKYRLHFLHFWNVRSQNR